MDRFGRNRVCNGTWSRGGGDGLGVDTRADDISISRFGEGGRDEIASRYPTIANMFPGKDARVMIVVTPTEAANSAAISLVSIPPVPTLLPGDDTIIVNIIGWGEHHSL